MSTPTLLVPLDLAGCAWAVSAEAAWFAERLGARVVLLYIVPLPDGVSPFATITVPGHDPATAIDLLDEDAQEHLAPFQEVFKDRGVETEIALRHGNIVEVILDTADEVDARTIIMGTHGRRGLERMLMGSVAEQVQRRAKVPCMTIRSPDRTAEPGPSAVQRAVAAETRG